MNARMYEVWAGIAKGQTNKEIAKQLGLSEKTIKGHATALFKQLGVSNRTQAAIAYTPGDAAREVSCSSTK